MQQHYARQEEWQRLFASRARQWAMSAGRVPADASREVIDRAVSEALLERGVSRGASPSSVKKWRTGRFAPPPTELLAVVEQLFGTGDELGDLLASITPDVPGNDAEPLAGPAEATGDGRRPAGPDGSGGSGSGDDRSTPGLGSGPDLDLGSGSGSGSRDPASAAYPGAAPPRRSPRRRALAVAAVLAAAVLVAGALFVNRRSPVNSTAWRLHSSGERCEPRRERVTATLRQHKHARQCDGRVLVEVTDSP